MPFFDVVGVNCNKGTTTEIKEVPRISSRVVGWIIVCVI